MLTWTERLQDASRTLALAAAVLVLVWAAGALAHDMQGHRSMLGGSPYLYGKRVGSPADAGPINCCLEGGSGDCQEVRNDELERVDGGYRYYGALIEEQDATLSPDGKLYVCQHKGSAPHCLFVTVPRT